MKKDSVVVITGANSGIGKAAAIKLAGLDAHVVMVCRNYERGMQALNEVRSKTGRDADLMICDLTDLKSVETFCDNFIKKRIYPFTLGISSILCYNVFIFYRRTFLCLLKMKSVF